MGEPILSLMTINRGFLEMDWHLPGDFRIHSDRLELVPCGRDLADAERDDVHRLSRLLDARVPNQWPPELVPDRSSAGGWWDWYIVRRKGNEDVLIGVAGIKGWPVSGSIQFGCSLLPDFQAQGYGTETVHKLTEWLLTVPGIDCVTADTPEGNAKAVAVLRHVGFIQAESDEPDLLRFQKNRK
jgi:ribosomal-protein-alanine N-acetyltransferase